MTTDAGWSGSWDPTMVDDETKTLLRDLAGAAILGKNGRPNEWCLVNLRTGELRYPARG
jgi:hypothetical protein